MLATEVERWVRRAPVVERRVRRAPVVTGWLSPFIALGGLSAAASLLLGQRCCCVSCGCHGADVTVRTHLHGACCHGVRANGPWPGSEQACMPHGSSLGPLVATFKKLHLEWLVGLHRAAALTNHCMQELDAAGGPAAQQRLISRRIDAALQERLQAAAAASIFVQH
jgi:hypothetical protein